MFYILYSFFSKKIHGINIRCFDMKPIFSSRKVKVKELTLYLKRAGFNVKDQFSNQLRYT